MTTQSDFRKALQEADQVVPLHRIQQDVAKALKTALQYEREGRDEGHGSIWDRDAFFPNGHPRPSWPQIELGRDQGNARIIRKRGNTIRLKVEWYAYHGKRLCFNFDVDVREKDLAVIRFHFVDYHTYVIEY